MRLKNRVAKAEERLEIIEEWSRDVAKAHNHLAHDFERLKKHISANGVLRDLRMIKEVVTGLADGLAQERRERLEFQDELSTNGVATAINKLNAEVFGQSKENGSTMERVFAHMAGVELGKEPSLAAKVDAIIEHLGIEVTVTPEKVTRTPEKATAKKVKKTKKGKR